MSIIHSIRNTRHIHKLPTARLSTYEKRRCFTVLALESSADDTCAAVVSSDRRILSNVVVKQNHVHEGYGGIYPWAAIDAHQKNMPRAVKRALDIAGLKAADVDGVAFTRGPGMGGCLSVCVNSAKTLAAALDKPIVGVHHMQAHALTPFLTLPSSEIPEYPFLTLLVSGGHTLVLLATSPTSFQTLATTGDESIGRTFDKVSRMLGLTWSELGLGAALERFCAGKDDPQAATVSEIPVMPSPARGQLAFSFSSYHSTIERYLRLNGGVEALDIATKRALARSFQTAAVQQLEKKLLLAFRWCEQRGIKINHVVASGGVASNSFLRERLQRCLEEDRPEDPARIAYPPASLCTDNAAMIAWASMHRFLAGDHDDYSIGPRSKWSIDDLQD